MAVIAASSTVAEQDFTRSLEELIYLTTTAALSQAGLTIDDIDGIVLSGNDETDGRVISIMPSAGPAGGVGHDTTMIASSADHALVYGYLRLLAGQGRRILVCGWAKPSEGVDPAHAELVEAEPYLLRNVGMNHTLASALQASRWADPARPVDGAVAWPLTAEDLPSRGDAVHAVVLAIDGAFPAGAELGWILDCGWATVTYELGQRDPGALDSLRLALEQIRGRTPWATDGLTAAEIAAGSEPAVHEATTLLGLTTGTVNRSGPLHADLTSPHVAGLGRMMAALRSVGDSPRPARVAGIGFHGFAGQGATVVVFANEKGDA